MSTATQPHYSSAEPPPSPLRGRSRQPPPPPPLWRRVRRVLLLGVSFALLPVAVSYVQVLTSSSNTGLGIRSVEWLRDNGASRLVSDVESWYYSLTAPAKGGPALRALPQEGVSPAALSAARGRGAPVVHYYRPPRIPPAIQPALPGEGVWRPAMAGAGPRPPVLVTTFRGESDYPRLVTGVAWIDSGATRFGYYPGALEPPVPINRGPEQVPRSLRRDLVATFNGGFKLHDAAEGYAYQGRTWAPMVDGIGTLVEYRGGRVDVISWHGGSTAGPEIALARQRPTVATLSNGEEEGKGNATLNEAIPLIRALPINYVGNVEGTDVTAGAVDVVVVDGFAGNIFLKGAEGVVATMTELIRQELTRNPLRMVLAAGLRPAFRAIRRRLSYEEYGGVPLLGVNGVCIVAHGRSTPYAMQNAIKAGAQCFELGLVERIRERLAVSAPAG